MVVFTNSEIWNGILGGAIIAAATSINLALRGKITGNSGILFNLVTRKDFLNNAMFVLGLLFMSMMLKVWSYGEYFDPPEFYLSGLSLFGFIVTGFLVGFGTKLCNGCTSGHAVCGLPRLSKRSIVAVLIFLSTGTFFATFCPSSLNFWSSGQLISLAQFMNSRIFYWIIYFLIAAALVGIFIKLLVEKNWSGFRDCLITYFVGLIFAYGLVKTGLVSRARVLGGLSINSFWNPTLYVVVAVAVGINFVTFYLIFKYVSKPLYGDKIDLPSNTRIDLKLILGAFIFGMGWGLSGICPGPAIVVSFVYLPHTALYLASIIGGQFAGAWFGGVMDRKLGSVEEKLVP